MTTVFCTKDFMIADRRATRSATDKAHGQIRDKVTKIIQPVNRCHVNKRIVAMAGAGNVSFIEYVRRLVTNKFFSTRGEAREIRDDFNMLPGYMNARFLALLEDGNRVIYTLEDHRDDPFEKVRDSFSVSRVNASEPIVAIGSGNSRLSMVESRLRVKDVPLHELFMYCTHLDDGSSYGFSAYSRQDDQLAPVIHYSDEERLQILERVHGQIDYLGLDKKPKAGTIWSREYEKMD